MYIIIIIIENVVTCFLVHTTQYVRRIKSMLLNQGSK